MKQKKIMKTKIKNVQWIGRERIAFFSVILGLCISIVQAVGTTPQLINYQGYLVDSNGNPLGNGTPKNYNIRFKMYDNQSAGTLKWSEDQVVTVNDGYFNVYLGEKNPITSVVFTGKDSDKRYIGITVDLNAGSDFSNEQEIVPRLRLLSAPYAMKASNGIPAGGVIMWTGAITDIPDGWALCNGQTKDGVQTPDLSGRFIVGAGTLGTDTYNSGDTNVNGEGKSKVTLTVDQMPSHTHSITDPGHTHTVLDEWLNVRNTQAWPGGGGNNSTWVADDSPEIHPKKSATRTSSKGFTGITANATGGNLPHENRPPYYALAYIMRLY